MPHALVRESVPADVPAVASRMRLADQAEVEACGLSPRESLERGLLFSSPCYTIEVDGAPAGMFGVCPTPHRIGWVWLLGTDDLLKIKKTLHRDARPWIERLSVGYDYLTNYVDERNEVHVRWLRRLGFRFVAREPRQPYGLPFLRFVRAFDRTR